MRRRGFLYSLALLWLGGLWLVAPSAAADRPLLISFEAIPAANAEQAIPSADLIARGAARAPYEQRAKFTQAMLTEMLPEILRALGIDPLKTDTRIVPGGFQLRTNPSLQTKIAIDDRGATRLAAALGFVFGQDSVLVSDLDDPQGGAFYAVVGFPPGKLTPDLAQLFFRRAAETDAALGEGYTAFGDEMIFINLRDAAGVPYGRADDPAFAAALERAAAAFTPVAARLVRTGRASARFIANDWSEHRLGEAYAARLDGVTVLRLVGLRIRFSGQAYLHSALLDWRRD